MNLVLATRSSPLALWQAHAARDTLRAADGAHEIGLLPVRSSGDADRTTDLARFGRIGIFTVEVDRALLDGRARIGVHSLKDMTTTLEDGVVLAGVLPRGPVEDALVGATLADLPRGGRVATGSLRRAAMLRALRPDARVVQIRGNVETRLAKRDAGEAEALLLARAGLVRLELDRHIDEVLDVERFVPAVGQGLVGLTCAADDGDARTLVEAVRDAESWACALAERALLRSLRGGCNVPLGAHARVAGGQLELAARVLSVDGQRAIGGRASGPTGDAEELGAMLAEELLQDGAGELIEAART